MSACDRSDGFKELRELLVIGSQIKSVICCQESSNIWIKNMYFLSQVNKFASSNKAVS